ncbi:MAG: 2-oxoacid:acceptor oxidoreductase family protein [Thermoanaerobaculia bacterium]|nr:2-oxoacid:acceptor oxidoreductase family protein [Thermoanaerobaculia bacterium]
MKTSTVKKQKRENELEAKYPGKPKALDGSAAVVEMETAASEAAGAYPITPSTQMGEGWAVAYAEGKLNVNGRRLIFFEPEGEHAAAAVTAGMSMTGLRSTNFSSGQGIAYMHESLYAAVGKRLTYVLNVATRAMTKHSLNVHAGHDDYHAVDDTGFFQLFAKNVQESADLNLIAHRIAELSLNPGLCAQDGFLTSHVIESVRLPERDFIREYLGDPSDMIESPTPAQKLVFGDTRRRIPEMFDVDYPAMLGVVQNQDSYAQGVAAQRPFYFDHLPALTDQAMREFEELTGRHYARAMGYRLDDAEWVIAGQGSVVDNAEAVVDYLREERGLKIGVLNLTMFRPFPADLVASMLAGRKGVVVLERTDQPLAVDLPLLREIRAAMSKAVENGRIRFADEQKSRLRLAKKNNGGNGKPLPHPSISALIPEQVPDFYSGCFGLGSRDLQPGDIISAVENMLPDGKQRRQFYLGVDFVRGNTRLPKLQVWQEQLLDAYPQLPELALESAGDFNLMPEGSLSLRIHSVGGWGAITMGKNLALTAFDLLGLHIKANPKYGSEKKGQPTTFYATLAHDPIRLNCELRNVDVVLSPDPNVFRNSDPLAGLSDGGVFVIQSDEEPTQFWKSLPLKARHTIREKNIKVFALDAFQIASEEASDADLRYRMQGAAFLGAFFAASPLLEREGLDRDRLFDGIRSQFQKKFGHLGDRVVEDNLRVIRRGFDEMIEIAIPEKEDEGEELESSIPQIPSAMATPNVKGGIADPGRFWEQVGTLCQLCDDGIADPFAAIAAMPAASSAIRDMTSVRFEVPEFIAEKCTGCGQCWVQCPDSAIPGLVTSIDVLIDKAIARAGETVPVDRMKQIARNLSKECYKITKGVPFKSFGEVVSTAYRTLVEKLNWDAERRAELDKQFAPVYTVLSEFPLAKTGPFFDSPDAKQKGMGGLLSVTVNPETCKGCNLCVAECPDGALITVRQDEETVDKLRRNWEFWKELPDTPDRFINVHDLEEGIGTLSSVLLKKDNYMSMAGGDGACMGCGEKTAVHLVLSSVEALMRPRVKARVEKIDEMIAGLDQKARELLASEADLETTGADDDDEVVVPLSRDKKQRVDRISKLVRDLQDLRWRYTEGPGGRGRSSLGMTNSTGCSSVWGSTYPYNPYPFPWANHLFQDAPSLAIGVCEGLMRKMADGFASVRKAELELADEWNPEVHEQQFVEFDWKQFTDEEMALCPPIIAMGGDGAMLDIGFQNLSRLLASGKPLRVIVLDTQVYSNTGGQACTSGYTGQVSDMAAWGKAYQGKQEERKELALIAMAHRGAFVHQTSQASATHLIAGVLKAMQTRRPSIINIYTPCPVEHGLADDWSQRAARLALESRAFPFLTYDPDAGRGFSECLDLEGNPDVDLEWPQYSLEYETDDGQPSSLELPLTIADWAATEGRFRKSFKPVPDDADEDELAPFHEYLAMDEEERNEKTPYIWTLDKNRKLARLRVGEQIVRLAEERQLFWSQIRELAGVEVSEDVRDRVASQLEEELEGRLDTLRKEYEEKIAELKATYPTAIARRMAEGLLRAVGTDTFEPLLEKAGPLPALGKVDLPAPAEPKSSPAETPSAPPQEAEAAKPAPEPATVDEEEEDDDELTMDPYIETARCTSCNECTNLNNKMFAYDENKQAYIKDPKAGTFQQLVKAAELCPAELIHPGTPLNPKEKDLEKWIKRAERFN